MFSSKIHDRELILGLQNYKDNVYHGIEICYMIDSDLLYGGIENWLSPFYTPFLSLYIFRQRHWPYPSKALKRG